jgi:uncharacterized membrane protein YgcG
MKLQSSPLFSAMAAALIFGTLGMSGLVSAVNSPFTINPAETAPPNPAAANLESAPADAILSTTGAVAPAVQAPEIAVPARDVPSPALTAPALDPNQEVAGSRGFGLRLSSDGLLPGRFSFVDSATGIQVAAKRLTISFLRGGEVLAQARPGVGGVFQASGLAPGVYSMIASGPDGYLATAILVLPPVIGQGAGLQIDGALVPPENVPLVRKLIRDRIFPSRRVVTGSAELDIANRVSKPYRTPLLTIGRDGHFRGRLNYIDPQTEQRVLASECTVFLIRGREIRASVDVNQNGIFDFDSVHSNLETGEYSLLVTPRPWRAEVADARRTATRRSGYAAMGVSVVKSIVLPQNNAVGQPRQSPYQLVSSRRLGADDEIADIDIIPSEDIEAETGSEEEGSDEAATAGGGGGGGGAGGSGGGGGGGLLAGALLGAGAGFALGSLGDDNPPASPAPVK